MGQGHPKAARLWGSAHQHHLERSRIWFQVNYSREVHLSCNHQGFSVLFCQQVDDFSIAMTDPEIARYVYAQIGQKLQLPAGETDPLFIDESLVNSLNGMDILQTCHYIKTSCLTYILQLLAARNWSTPQGTESTIGSKPFEPFPEADHHAVYATPGFASKNTAEHASLAKEMGFSYLTLLSELLYAYITARPDDIGYAIATLAKFSTAHSKIHYQ